MPASKGSKRFCLQAPLLVIALGLAHAGNAQFEQPQLAQPYIPGEQVNLFSSWGGSDTPNAFFIQLPDGWELASALAVRHGYQHVPFSVSTVGLYGYLVVPDGFLRGDFTVIVQATTPDYSASQQANWSIVPAARAEIGGVDRHVPMEALRRRRPLKAAPSDASTFVLTLDGTQASLQLGQAFTQRLSGSYTLEFWLRTTALNAIVLSGWDGQRDHRYDLEFVIDASGAVRYFRNTSGEHVNLGSNSPVADGTWHHVAVTRDRATAWTRLFVDGVIADSLFDPVVEHLQSSPALAIGGRLSQPASTYRGDIDDIRLWSTARSAAEIQLGMWQKAMEETPQVSVLTFESSASRSRFLPGSSSLQRRRGGPTLSVQPKEFRGVFGDGRIYLSWRSQHPLTREFIVDRSDDGQTFETIGQLPSSSQSDLYTLTDENVINNVMYYRLRQRFDNGAEQITATLKVGLGADEVQETARLLGNHPNPFNPRTTISYEVLNEQQVKISVLDLSGHLIDMLVDRQHEAGHHEAVFDGTDYTSGIYFVRLSTSEGQVQTHQIILTK